MTFRSDTPVLDRAGGPLRLREIAGRLVGHDWRLEVVESTGPRPVTVLLVVRDDRPYDTIIEVSTGRSPAIRADQVRDLERDANDLRPILEAEIRRLDGRPKGAHL